MLLALFAKNRLSQPRHLLNFLGVLALLRVLVSTADEHAKSDQHTKSISVLGIAVCPYFCIRLTMFSARSRTRLYAWLVTLEQHRSLG
jgi:multisubunit Na+/H+ antiporter MnhG subunit